MRLTPYYFNGDAENVVINKKMGTQRIIWTTYYDTGTCYDQAIKTYYTTIGSVLMGFAGFFTGIVFVFIIYSGIEIVIKHHRDVWTNIVGFFNYEQI